MSQVEPVARYTTIQVPADVGKAVDAFAERAHLSRNKAAAVLIRRGLEAEEGRVKRLRELVNDIRAAATDAEADKFGDELIELTFGPQKKTLAQG